MLKRLEPNHQGALLMLVSMAAFTCNDTLVKLVGGHVPLWQVLVVRGALASVLLLGLARAMGVLHLRIARADLRLVLLRCAAEVASTYLFLSALLVMPLANVTAVLQMLPLTVTLGAALFFGERVGWRRRLAICLGLCGMLLIVRPGGESFGAATLYALAAVVVLTARDLVTRRMSPTVPSLMITLLSAGSVTVFGALMGIGESWQPIAGPDWGLLIASALLILLAYLCAVMTVRVGEVSAVAPLRYTGLVWALVLGWFVFGDWPDALTLSGAGIVVLAGVFTLLRERELKVETAAQAVAGIVPPEPGSENTDRM